MTCYVVGEHINPNGPSVEALGNRSGKGISNATKVLISRTCIFVCACFLNVLHKQRIERVLLVLREDSDIVTL